MSEQIRELEKVGLSKTEGIQSVAQMTSLPSWSANPTTGSANIPALEVCGDSPGWEEEAATVCLPDLSKDHSWIQCFQREGALDEPIDHLEKRSTPNFEAYPLIGEASHRMLLNPNNLPIWAYQDAVESQ